VELTYLVTYLLISSVFQNKKRQNAMCSAGNISGNITHVQTDSQF